MRRFLVLLSLILVVPSVSADAAPPKGGARDELTDRERALRALLEIEVRVLGGIIDAIQAGLDADPDIPVTPAGKEHWRLAKEHYAAAKALHADGKPKQAYEKFRQATDEVHPVMDEILAFDKVPQDVQDAFAEHVRATAQRIETVAQLIGDHANPAGTQSYADAKVLYDEAKVAWDAGQKRDAVKKLEQSLKQLDQAIRTTWADAAK